MAISRTMLRATSAVARTSTRGVRFASTGADEHKAWLEAVKKYPVVIPKFEWTLEWMLPSPPPLHQFEQSPIVIEVKDRNPDADALLYQGPNVVGGYVHPEEKRVVSQAEHAQVLAKYKSKHAEHNGHSKPF